MRPEKLKQLTPFIKDKKDVVFWTGKGCESCEYTGYSGCMGIFEFLRITPAIKQMIAPKVTSFAIKKTASKEGYLRMVAAL